MRLLIFLIGMLLCSQMAFAGDVFDRVGAAEGVDPDLLRAIAMQESGMNRYALNCDGENYSPATLEQAMLIFRHHHMMCDVGYMQVNYGQNGLRFKIPVSTLFRPAVNVRIAARILKEDMAGTNNPWKAVGRYHSWTRKKSRRYAWKVHRYYMAIKHRSDRAALP